MNADKIAEMFSPHVGTDEEARSVAQLDRQKVGRRVEPKLARVRHVCMTTVSYKRSAIPRLGH